MEVSTNNNKTAFLIVLLYCFSSTMPGKAISNDNKFCNCARRHLQWILPAPSIPAEPDYKGKSGDKAKGVNLRLNSEEIHLMLTNIVER
jgi:hypothetical protein